MTERDLRDVYFLEANEELIRGDDRTDHISNIDLGTKTMSWLCIGASENLPGQLLFRQEILYCER